MPQPAERVSSEGGKLFGGIGGLKGDKQNHTLQIIQAMSEGEARRVFAWGSTGQVYSRHK